jgi:hypothetical protein
MNKKLLALILALVLALGCLTACGSTDTDTQPEETAEPEETEAPDTDEGPDKFDLAYDAYDPDAVVMTVNGEDVTWSEYFYWICSIAQQLDSYVEDLDWSDDLDETYTYQGYAQYYAETMLGQYWTIAQKAQELNLSLTDEEQAQVDEIYNEDVDSYGDGDEAAFLEYLDQLHIPMSLYTKMNTISAYYLKIFEHYFGEMGADLSDEDVATYANDAGYMRAKHILFKTVDDSGDELDADTLAEKLAAAEDALSQLKGLSGQELTDKFDELMNELSEDSGLTYYPNGYYFLSGEMVQEFEDATLSLEENQVSDVVESPYGYHIVLRLPLEADIAMDYNGYTLRYVAASALFESMTNEWFDDTVVEYTPEFADLDFNTLFA